MFRLQWSAPNSSGDYVAYRVSSEGSWKPPLPTVPLPTIRRKQIQQLPPNPTTFFQNTSMLQRIDPRLNNTKCMSCGKGAV
jgi:hypothetical protein